MQIEVLFFARLRELAECDSCTIEVDRGACVADAVERVGETFPAIADHLGSCRVALDEEFARIDAPIAPGTVVAIIPPVSGG